MDRAISYPNPPLAGTRFVMRPFREDDFGAARGMEQDAATARWVPELPADDGAGVVAFYEECRRDGSLLHLAIADRLDRCIPGRGDAGARRAPGRRARLLASSRGTRPRDRDGGTRGADRLGALARPRPRPRAGVRRTRERRGAHARAANRLPARGRVAVVLGARRRAARRPRPRSGSRATSARR